MAETEERAFDPTHGNLEAALLDQKIAGLFVGKDYAYAPVMQDNGKWGIGIAVANEQGYSPVLGSKFEWSDYREASRFCDGMNGHIGLPRDHAASLIASTMDGMGYSR